MSRLELSCFVGLGVLVVCVTANVFGAFELTALALGQAAVCLVTYEMGIRRERQRWRRGGRP